MKNSNEKLQCLNCFHCKTRVFATVTDIKKWCGERSIKPNSVWVNDITTLGMIRLMWCEMQTDQHCSHGFSPRNASPKHTTSILDLRRMEKSEVVVTNQSKKTFIPDCPYWNEA